MLDITYDTTSMMLGAISAVVSISCCVIAVKSEKHYPGGFSPSLILILFYALYNCAGSCFITRTTNFYYTYFVLVHCVLIFMVLALLVENKIFEKKKLQHQIPIKESSLITKLVMGFILLLMCFLLFSKDYALNNITGFFNSLFTLTELSNYNELRSEFATNVDYLFYFVSRGLYPLCIAFFFLNCFVKKQYLGMIIFFILGVIPSIASLQKSPIALLVLILIFGVCAIKNVQLNIKRLAIILLVALLFPVIITIFISLDTISFEILVQSYINRIILLNTKLVYLNVVEAQNHMLFLGGASIPNLYKFLGLPYNDLISKITYYNYEGFYIPGASANSTFISNLYWDFRLIGTLIVSFILIFSLKVYTDIILFVKKRTVFTYAIYGVLTTFVIKFCLTALGTVLFSEGTLSVCLLGLLL